MTQEEILDYNKRCAEFLGAKYDPETLRYIFDKELTDTEYTTQRSKRHHEKQMCFHSDWNWIMEVKDAISNIKDTSEGAKWDMRPFSIIIGDNIATLDIDSQYYLVYFKEEEPPFQHIDGNTTKEAVVEAINQFLIWYKDTK